MGPDDIGDPQRFDDLDRALKHSRDVRAPIFIYWGTKWCPPCAEMQVTVLQRPDFRARSNSMVALAVDGDDLGAQVCGERLDTDVYPTVLVLDGDAREWLRLPGGLTEVEFCAAIDSALRTRTPMSVLADTLEQQPRENDLALLAFHCWPQDRRINAGTRRLAFLERLDAAVAEGRPEFAARVLTWRLVEQVSRTDCHIEATARYRLYDRFLALLHSGRTSYSSLYYLLVNVEPVVAFLCENDDARRRDLTELMHGVLERLIDDEALSWTERLIAQSASMTLRTGLEVPGGPHSVLERTRAMVAKADEATLCATERQSVMNMAGHLLRQAGLREESIRLFSAEIDRSPWPTYFMPYVAEMYMEQDDREQALRWWQRSYDETPGKTTRFELGVRYIAALVRHAPQERAVIERMAARLFSDRGDDADMARGRVRKSLGLLARTLRDWQA